MNKSLKTIPKFKSESEEQDFWFEKDSTEYIEWNQSKLYTQSSPQLKRSVKTISLRLTESMLNDLKILANKSDVPYQSLIKIILQERIDKELH